MSTDLDEPLDVSEPLTQSAPPQHRNLFQVNHPQKRGPKPSSSPLPSQYTERKSAVSEIPKPTSVAVIEPQRSTLTPTPEPTLPRPAKRHYNDPVSTHGQSARLSPDQIQRMVKHLDDRAFDKTKREFRERVEFEYKAQYNPTMTGSGTTVQKVFVPRKMVNAILGILALEARRIGEICLLNREDVVIEQLLNPGQTLTSEIIKQQNPATPIFRVTFKFVYLKTRDSIEEKIKLKELNPLVPKDITTNDLWAFWLIKEWKDFLEEKTGKTGPLFPGYTGKKPRTRLRRIWKRDPSTGELLKDEHGNKVLARKEQIIVPQYYTGRLNPIVAWRYVHVLNDPETPYRFAPHKARFYDITMKSDAGISPRDIRAEKGWKTDMVPYYDLGGIPKSNITIIARQNLCAHSRMGLSEFCPECGKEREK